MALDIVGAGFGRTGTLSLKIALEKLGINKTYHMMEVFQNPQHLDLWTQALDSGNCDWDSLFDGYRASVDWPACSYWQTLADYYPDSKVILSLRNPDSWFDSVHKTIYPSTLKGLATEDTQIKQWAEWANKLIWEKTFSGRITDREYAVNVFNENIKAVKKNITTDRLLIFEAAEGWPPLCEFLGCDIPDEPYPRTNSAEEFLQRK